MRYWIWRGIDRAKIPEIQPCGTILGRISREAAAELGISQSACIVTGAMDQAASAVGGREPGTWNGTETTGTCQTVLCTCQSPEIRKLSPLTYYCHGISGKYLKLIYSETAGMALKWFRREFCADLMKEEKSFEQMSALAEKEPILSRGVIFYPPWQGPKFREQIAAQEVSLGSRTGQYAGYFCPGNHGRRGISVAGKSGSYGRGAGTNHSSWRRSQKPGVVPD